MVTLIRRAKIRCPWAKIRSLPRLTRTLCVCRILLRGKTTVTHVALAV